MDLTAIPITERSNPKSEDIDLLKAEDITELLSDCENEIFGGYNNSLGIYDKDFVRNCVQFSENIQKVIQDKGKTNVILVGAGTSGRLCRLMAKVLNPIVGEKINLIPIIAGGIKALVRAEPNTEDRLYEGVADYLSYTKNIDRSNCFVIGVTCGLSASYVKGALDEANKYTKGKTSIIGFNPKHLATVELGDEIQILNPIIGPEPIVGSVRMKGGTTTMILIYALVTSSIKTNVSIRDLLTDTFNNSQEALSKIRDYKDEVSELINVGHETLQSGGSIYLIGSYSYGPLCVYDAAECPPTFGARINQVNGFSQNGVRDLVYYSYEKGEKMAKEIDVNVFIKEALPNLTKKDTVLILRNTEESIKNINKIFNSKLEKLYSTAVSQRERKMQTNNTKINIIFKAHWKNHFQKLLFIRSLLVQLSTGSFVLNGKVYENKMIDLRITNKKLFLRVIRIVEHITHKDKTNIRKALLKSIYGGTVPSKNSLEDHIALSASKENIVPLTILSLVYPGKKINELRLMLRKEPIVRKLVIKELANLH